MAYTVVPMYNINQAVGPACPNFRADVMLVQFMLAMMCMNSGWPTTRVRPMWAAPGGFAAIYPIDGEYKPELAEWIKHFQASANSVGEGPLTVDGKVNPVKVAWGNATIKQTNAYTIQVMNRTLCHASRNLFEKLPEHPWVPGPLRADLTTLRFATNA